MDATARDPLGLGGKTVLVTGGARGIGHAVASASAAAGAHVAVTSRKKGDAETAALSLAEAHGAQTAGFGCDVSDAGAVAALFEAVDSWAPSPLAGLVNNAGYPLRKEWWDQRLGDYSPNDIEHVFREVADVDLGGSRRCTYHALHRMVKNGGGRIVYVASTPALTGYKGTPYTEAKAATLGLMRDVAREYGPQGIRANAVALGNVKTEQFEDFTPDEQAALAAEAPLNRWGEPAEVADAILFFLSDLSRFVTGQTLIVDGGTVMR